MHHHATRTASAVVFFVLLSAGALVAIAACGSDDVAAIPAPDDAGGSSGELDGSGQTDGPTTEPSDAGQDTGSGGPVVDAECAAFADAYCDLFERCYPILLGGLVGEPATCRARAGLGCALSIQSPGAAKVAAACSAALKAATCTSNLTDIDPSCRIKGTLAADAVCEYDGQCQSGSCSKKGVTGPCATCKARVLENGSCAAADCDWGLQCAEGTCVTPLPLNGLCSKGRCAPPNRCVSSTCQGPLPKDEVCVPVGPSFDDMCDAVKGEFCRPGLPARCTAITFADPGGACGIVDGGLAGCKGTASCKAGKCVTNAADGAACNTTSGPDCTGPAECINGACAFPKPDRCK